MTSDLAATYELLREFPERLRAHRWRLNLSLRDVGDAAGLASRSVHAIERREHDPNMKTLLLLLDWMARSEYDEPRPGESREHAWERARRARAARKVRS